MYVAGRLLKQGWSVDRRKEENNHSLMATFILNKKTRSRILEFSQEIRELRQCVHVFSQCVHV